MIKFQNLSFYNKYSYIHLSGRIQLYRRAKVIFDNGYGLSIIEEDKSLCDDPNFIYEVAILRDGRIIKGPFSRLSIDNIDDFLLEYQLKV